jgi:hypothetical protein
MKEDFVCFLDVLRTVLEPCAEALGRNREEPGGVSKLPTPEL